MSETRRFTPPGREELTESFIIKDATGQSITELNVDLDSTGHLTEGDLEQVVGGFRIYIKG